MPGMSAPEIDPFSSVPELEVSLLPYENIVLNVGLVVKSETVNLGDTSILDYSEGICSGSCPSGCASKVYTFCPDC